jgi:hypothetical protein
MSGSGSVTALVERLKDGDHEAARLLWQRYYPRLVALARQKLRGSAPPGGRRGGRGPQRLR